MKKNKFLKLLIIILGLFFIISFGIVYAFDCKTVCQPPLTTFSDGNSTFDVSFPPGGGTTCDTITDCPTITLPDNATIFSMKVDMELTDPASEIGTPYIWIPNSGSGTFAQIRTSDGTLVKLYQNSIDGFPANAFSTANSGISRVTVVPGADVYVANRGNTKITRLIPNPAPAEDYQYGGQLDMGEDYIRALTFDMNGYIWGATAGNGASDRIRVFCGMNTTNPACTSFDVQLAELISGYHYGAIGDRYGFVWTVGNGEIRSYSYNAGTITKIDSDTVANSYGIGIDNDANIWVGRWMLDGEAWKVIRDSDGNIVSTTNYSAGVSGGGRGIAGDIDNNNWLVIDDPSGSPLSLSGWTTNSSRVVKYDSSGAVLGDFPTGTGSTGAAVDFDNNIWVVNYGGGGPNFTDPNLPDTICFDKANDGVTYNGGTVTKLQLDGTVIATYPTCGNTPYNYSDMTGLRTVPKSISIDGGASIPLSDEGTFVIYSGVCVPAALSSCISPPGSISCGSESGLCEIPLEIFSMQAGDYTLKNLEVIYGKQVPITTGGLVPCGRADNNPATPWNDTDPCDLCFLLMLINKIMNFLLALAAGIAMLALIITGFLFITSAGNEERRTSAKQALKFTLIGFIVIFMSWLMVDFLLSAWGYLDPLGGEWNVVCD